MPVIPWQAVLAQYNHSLTGTQPLNPQSLSLFDELSFENIEAYKLADPFGLGDALRAHVKVELDPEVEYHEVEPILLDGPMYLIGNGATVHVNCDIGFRVTSQRRCPRVQMMEEVAIVNTCFQAGDHNGSKIKLIRSDRMLILQGCVFFGFFKTCISARAGLRARGCHFSTCHVAIVCYYSTACVKQCIFEKCVIGVVGQCKLLLKRCSCVDSICLAIFASIGSMTHCTVFGPPASSPLYPLRMCTCVCGHARRLRSVHVVSNRALCWPSMNWNTLTNASVYLGNRRGVFHPVSTMFSFTTIDVEMAASYRISLQHCYESYCFVRKLGQICNDRTPETEMAVEQCVCHCERVHVVTRPLLIDITHRCVANRTTVSVSNGDLSSEEEDDM